MAGAAAAAAAAPAEPALNAYEQEREDRINCTLKPRLVSPLPVQPVTADVGAERVDPILPPAMPPQAVRAPTPTVHLQALVDAGVMSKAEAWDLLTRTR